MKIKIFILLMGFVFLSSFVSAEITSLNNDVVFPGDTIQLTMKPTKSGFLNIIDVFQNITLVDTITVNCQTICTKKNIKVNYIIPNNFMGEFYFATFDYGINDYELDFFNVINQGEASEGELLIQEFMNTNSGTSFIINPEQGKNASITLDTTLKVKNCDTFNINAYLCNSTIINSCSDTVFNHEIDLSFASQTGRTCHFTYVGEDFFPFYQPTDNWKVLIKSGTLRDEFNFTYTSLTAINYTSVIDFGSLNARVWNVDVPLGGLDMINHGNLPLRIDWGSDGFTCISVNCTDFWEASYQGEDRFQIDDDPLFSESVETGIDPVFITNFSLNFFPQNNISVCTSSNCDNDINERIKTHFNLKIPDIQRGVYEGNVVITIN